MPHSTTTHIPWWHRLGVRVHNLWRYHVWTACAHRWLLTLDAQGLAGWICADCRARGR